MARAPLHVEDEKIALSEEKWLSIADGVKQFSLPGNEAVRRIITGRRNGKVGGFYSWKNRAHVMHESDGEERCARVLDVHSAVTAFFGQPETLMIEVEGRAKPEIYTPDFLAYFGDHEVRIEYKRLIDIRPPKPKRAGDERAIWLRKKAAKTMRHLRIARNAYRRAGLIWILIRDVDLAAMANLDTVDDIVANGGRPIAPHDLDRLIGHLRASQDGCASLGSCENLLNHLEFPRGDILARIQERKVTIDLQTTIGPDTLVHLVRD